MVKKLHSKNVIIVKPFFLQTTYEVGDVQFTPYLLKIMRQSKCCLFSHPYANLNIIVLSLYRFLHNMHTTPTYHLRTGILLQYSCKPTQYYQLTYQVYILILVLLKKQVRVVSSNTTSTYHTTTHNFITTIGTYACVGLIILYYAVVYVCCMRLQIIVHPRIY